MKKKPGKRIDVSVIIPTKNEGKVFRECMASLKKQKTSATYEVLVVDTNSTDDTRAIAKKFGARIIKESRPGRNIAHISGSNAAKGNILCFTEADCILPPDWIEQYVQAFTKDASADAFVGRYVYHKSTPALTRTSRILMPIMDTLFLLLNGHFAFRASNFAIRAEALKKAGNFNPKAKEFDDVELSMRVAKIGTIKYLPKLIITTGDRRVRGRILQYLKEGSTNYIRTCILKQTVSEVVYADIR